MYDEGTKKGIIYPPIPLNQWLNIKLIVMSDVIQHLIGMILCYQYQFLNLYICQNIPE